MKTPWTNELSRLVFVELRRDISLGELTLSKDLPLPILFEEIEEKVTREAPEDFTSIQILTGILYLFGLDPDFREPTAYAAIVEHIEQKSGSLFGYLLELSKSDEKLALILGLGYHHLGFQDERVFLLSAELADTLARSESSALLEDIAFTLYEEAHAISPSWQSHYHLAFHYYNRESFPEALSHFSAAYPELPTQELKVEVAQLLAMSEQKMAFEEGKELFYKERFDEAIEKFRSLEEDFPGWYPLFFYLGVSYRMMEDYTQALSAFYRALSLRKDDPQLYNEMAICLLMLEDPLQAEPLLEAALQLDKDNPELLCNRAIVFLNTDRNERAMEDLLRARELDPDEPLYEQWLNFLLRKEGDIGATQ